MKTAIVTDTNSGITVEEGRENGIYVIAMPVVIDGECYFEGVDITNGQLYEALKNGRDVSSSQPSPGDVMESWNALFQEGYDEIVYIPMSSGLSGSCHSAAQFAAEYGGKVHVADSHRISVTLMESVYEAKHMADRGCPAGDIKEYLERSAYQSSIYVAVNSLKYLKKSGRITASAAAVASMLNIKPVLTIQVEKLDLYTKVRGMKQSGRKMAEAIKADIESRFSEADTDRIRIGAAGTFEKEEDSGWWMEMVQETFPDIEVYYRPLSCSIASHVGIDSAGIGVCVINE